MACVCASMFLVRGHRQPGTNGVQRWCTQVAQLSAQELCDLLHSIVLVCLSAPTRSAIMWAASFTTDGAICVARFARWR
jgi:hypothetical protein